MSRSRLSFLSPFLLLLSAAAFVECPLYAQAVSGDLVGAIVDASAALVPAAMVAAVNLGTGLKATAVTNDRGEYRFINLPAGEYRLVVTASGFAERALTGVEVRLNATATANVALQVAAAVTTLDVVEAGPEVDTTTAQIQNIYTERQAADLPVATTGLGVLNLSLLGTGVASSGGIGVGSGPSVGGQRPRNNNFTVDGVDDNNK